MPTIYFGTRTHKQIANVVKELRKTAYAKNDFNDSRILLRLLENPFSDEPIENILKDMDLNDEYKESE